MTSRSTGSLEEGGGKMIQGTYRVKIFNFQHPRGDYSFSCSLAASGLFIPSTSPPLSTSKNRVSVNSGRRRCRIGNIRIMQNNITPRITTLELSKRGQPCDIIVV